MLKGEKLDMEEQLHKENADNLDSKTIEANRSVNSRKRLYLMHEALIEASKRTVGKPSEEIFLEGRIKDKVRIENGINDEIILDLLTTCQGFRQLVHSIGVYVKTHSADTEVVFVLQNWGKRDRFQSGTLIKLPCPKDGSEATILLEDYTWSDDDDVLGRIGFEFNKVGELAHATVILYLNNGFDVPEAIIEPPVEFGTENYKKMIEKSLFHLGNTRRLKAAIEKAERGEDVTIAYIGGSITQGAGAKPINKACYAYQSFQTFKELFGKHGGDNIHYVKAGVGGTPSQLGIIRYDRDVLKDGKVEPDIVIVEFAVNDEGDETKGVCYESLCLKILSAANKPALVLLFSVFQSDWNLQDRLSLIGLHYDLPMVSVKDAVVEQFKKSKDEGNIISKRQYFHDIYHPSNNGHKIMADCLSHLFLEVKNAKLSEIDISLDKRPVKGNDFVDIKLLDRKDNSNIATIIEGSFTEIDKELQEVEMDLNKEATPQFPYNWMRNGKTGNESFIMKISSRNLMLVFKDSGSPDFGKADIYVDGKYFKTADPHINNWNHCNPIILYQEERVREHTIEIKMAEGDEEKCFTILGFGYTL